METYDVQCHCGNIRAKFTRQKDLPLVVWDCNCSDCNMRRNLHFMVPAREFWLVEPDAGAVEDDNWHQQDKILNDGAGPTAGDPDATVLRGTSAAKRHYQNNTILYQWGTKTAVRRFCKTCGILPFYIPRSNPDGLGVTFPCVDWEGKGGGGESTNKIMPKVEMRKFDGVHWEESHKATGIADQTKVDAG
ncbi:hypothetical protein ACHAXS_009268 [Conticribra weissflogii]